MHNSALYSAGAKYQFIGLPIVWLGKIETKDSRGGERGKAIFSELKIADFPKLCGASLTVFWKWLFQQLLYRKWVKIGCEALYYFFFSTESTFRKSDSKNKRTLLDLFFYLTIPLTPPNRARSWHEYQKIKCLWPELHWPKTFFDQCQPIRTNLDH